jgi:hypothetical protein
MSSARPDLRSPAWLLVFGYTALTVALFACNGRESLLAAMGVALAIGAWAKALGAWMRGAPLAVESAVTMTWYVAIASTLVQIVLSGELGERPPSIFAESSFTPFFLLDGAALVLVLTFWFDIVRQEALPRELRVARRVGFFLLALAMGVWLLRASPDPQIDVFPAHQQAARAMLEGKSIYEPGVLYTFETFKNRDLLDEYMYPPLSACLSTVAYVVTHDVRWADLVSQLLGGAMIWAAAWRLTPRGASPRRRAWADMLMACCLFHPRATFVLEQAWTEPLAIPFLGGFVLLVLAKRPMLASISLGLLVAMKQHMFLYAPFLALVPGVGLAGFVFAGAAALATMVPFAIRTPYGFYRGVFGMVLHNPFRPDALTIPAELARIGIIVPTWVGFLAALVPFAWLRRFPRQLAPLLLASCVCFGLFYLLGRQGFCNYYYLLGITALFAAASVDESTDPQGHQHSLSFSFRQAHGSSQKMTPQGFTADASPASLTSGAASGGAPSTLPSVGASRGESNGASEASISAESNAASPSAASAPASAVSGQVQTPVIPPPSTLGSASPAASLAFASPASGVPASSPTGKAHVHPAEQGRALQVPVAGPVSGIPRSRVLSKFIESGWK